MRSPSTHAALSQPWWLALLFAVMALLVACSDSPPPAPSISVQPTDTSAVAGTAATLSVSASGPDIAYQWQQSTDGGSTWSDLAGATLAAYTTPTLAAADNGKRYRVVVSASAIRVTSSTVTLTVTVAVVAPAIGVAPLAVTVIAPANAVFSVTASGTALAYQWQRSTDSGASWNAIAGATLTSYDAGATSTSMSGEQYRVVVSNGAGSATSAAASLTVNAAPAAPVFTTQPADQAVTAGSAAAMSVAVTGVPVPTLQWQRSTDGGSTWTAIAGAIDPTFNSGLTTLSQNGERYRAVATNSAGSATSNAAALSVTPAPQAPAIATQPADQSVTAPAAATFTASASGVPTPTWQWQFSTDGGSTWANVNGATAASYTTPATTALDSGKRYRAVAGNPSGSVNSSTVTLTVTVAVVAPAIGVAPLAVTVIAPANAVFSVTASGTALAYQWQRSTDSGASWNAIAGATLTSYDAGATSTSMSGEQYRVVVSNGAGSATSAAASLTVNAAPAAPVFTTQPADQAVTAGSAAAMSVAVTGVPVPTLQWQRSTDGGSTWTAIAGAIDPTFNSGLTTLSQNGERYRAVATNSAGSATSNAAALSVTPAPQAPAIATQPADQSVTAPAAATFTASASGVPTPTWQWQFSTDGGSTWANVNGATAASYTTPATSVADSGRQYRAVASNSAGPVPSNAATLTVTAAPPAVVMQNNKVAAGARHTCAVKADASVACWGYNSSGQIGSGNYNDWYSPRTVALAEGVAAVAAGGFSSSSSCALTVTGNLWCWGGVVGNANVPTAIAGFTGVRWVAVGGIHACLISSAGNVYCWGNNGNGQLGDGSITSSPTPVQVRGALGLPLTDAVALAAGFMHTCALMSNGSVMCWGNSLDLVSGRIATLVPALSSVTALAAGDGAPCALLGNGTVACWTSGSAGWTVPTSVAGLSTVAAMAIGSQHQCAAGSNGSVRCWGTGLMGNGNVSETQPNPTLVSGLSNVGALAAGFQHTCALRNNGSLACWGSGSNGQLGQGDNIPRTTPADVPGGAVWALP